MPVKSSFGARVRLSRIAILLSVLIGSFVLVGPAWAVVASNTPPAAYTYQVTSTGASTAVVDGQVNPAGQTTTYDAAYGLQSSTWCSSFGSSGTPDQTTTAQTLGSTDTSTHNVSINLTGLTPGASYCVEVEASNSSGTGDGGIVEFTSGTPQVSTDYVTSTSGTAAIVDGSVNPVGQATTYQVQYALQSDQWCTSGGTSGTPTTTSAQTLGFNDDTSHSVSVQLTGLMAGADYCVQMIATNGSGQGQGGQYPFTSGSPQVSTDDVTSVNGTTAVVDGTIDPVNQATTYQVDYALQTDQWCTSGGNTGTPSQTTAQNLAATDDNPHGVSVNLTGLTPGGNYCAEMIATNGSGVGQGGQVYFTSGAPQATINDITDTGTSTAVVDGAVNPVGQTTTYQVDYALQSDQWCTSNGASGTPNTTAAQNLGFSDDTFHDVSVSLTGLTPGDSYCAELIANNAAGAGPSGQEQFTAGAPSVQTDSAQSTGGTTATVQGQVNPSGQATTYQVKYALQSDQWCTSNGTSGTPSTTAAQNLGFNDDTFHSVSVNLSGLNPGSSYCAELTATNGSGTAQGGQVPFTAGAPTAETDSAQSTSGTTATLSGFVDPSGQATTYSASYGLAPSTWCTSGGASGTPAGTTSSQTLGFTDENSHPVSVNLTGLSAGTQYCVELVANNAGGTATGGFTQFTSGLPTASTNDGTPAGAVEGTINPAGQATTYVVQYDLNSSHWCQTGGQFGSPASTTASQTLGSSDANDHDVTVNLSGLTTATTYCAQLVATNPSGSSQGGIVTFTYGSPNVQTDDVNPTGPTTAQVDGTVNPGGQNATYQAQWARADSTWCHSGGDSGTPDGTTGAQPLGSTDTSSHSVSVQLTGLTANTSYCAQLIATNSVGQGQGGQVGFTTLANGGTGGNGGTSGNGGTAGGGNGNAVGGGGVSTGSNGGGGTGNASGGGGNSGGQTTPAPSCSLTVTNGKVVTKKPHGKKAKKGGPKPGTVTLRATCSQGASLSLRGVLTQAGKKPKHGKAKNKVYNLGPQQATVGPGGSATFTVQLPAAALSALQKHTPESIAFTLAASNAGGSRQSTASIAHLHTA